MKKRYSIHDNKNKNKKINHKLTKFIGKQKGLNYI